MAVKNDRAIVGEACDGAVAGERPDAAGFDGDDGVFRDGGTAPGIFCDVDGAGEGAAVFQGEVQRRNGIDEDVAVEGLGVGSCRDGGIGDVNRRAGAVAEDAVAILGRGRDRRVLDGNRCAVGGEQRGVHAVEVAVFGVGGRAVAFF